MSWLRRWRDCCAWLGRGSLEEFDRRLSLVGLGEFGGGGGRGDGYYMRF